jgi:hypothetical protein
VGPGVEHDTALEVATAVIGEAAQAVAVAFTSTVKGCRCTNSLRSVRESPRRGSDSIAGHTSVQLLVSYQ